MTKKSRRTLVLAPRPPAARAAALAAGFAILVAAVLGTAAGPAVADGGARVTLRLEAPSTFAMYNADEGAEAQNGAFTLPVSVAGGDGGPARNVTVVVNTSGLKGVARAQKGAGGNCTGEGPVFTCAYGDVQNGDGESNAPFTLYGVDGVEPGDSGTVTYTVTADNASPVTGSTRMTVGEPTLYAPEEQASVKGLTPGKSVSLTPAFANRSRFTVKHGVGLRIDAGDGLRLTSRPGNCTFEDEFTTAWCVFDTKAAPHTAYRTAAPIRYTAQSGKLTGTLTYNWSAEPPQLDETSVRGTDAPLALTETSARGLTATSGSVRVDTDVQTDYEPVTATIRGQVGDTVTVRLGVRDHGPGRPLDDGSMGGFEVVPPEGTTVTSIPYTFEGDGGDWACVQPKKSGGAFRCQIGYDEFSEVHNEGGTTVIGFRIHIDRQVPGAHGTIRTFNPYDRTPGNDTAVIPLDASPAAAHRPTAPWGAIGAGAAVILAALTFVLVRRRRRG
ncbi:hypothetical protein ACWD4J_37655 [Streptomyces sp. NPDC002577]